MTAARHGELTRDRREHALDLAAQGQQDADGDHGDEGQDQGVLGEALAFLVPVKGGEETEIHVVDDGHFVPPG